MLPAVTRVTLTQSSIFAIQVDAFVSLCYLRLPVLPCYPNSPVYLQFKLRNLCHCVTCGYPCYPVTQTQSSKFAFKLDVFVSLCYLRLPLLPCYPNIDQ